MTKTRRSWKWHSLVSYFLLFSGIILTVSGIALYVAPPGRIANFTDWRLLALDKGQWEAVHTLFGYAVLLFGIWHLVLNWKVLLSYLRDRVSRAYKVKAEFTVALILTLLIAAGSIAAIPPFSTVMDWGESLKNAWDTGGVIIEHEDHGDPATPTPADAPPTAEPGEEEHEESHGSMGWGRFTVEEICTEYNVSLADGLAHLADYGIEADASSRVRTLADRSGYTPSEIIDIIRGTELGTTEGR